MHKKTCKNCNKTFTLKNRDLDFYKRIKITEPTFCPSCRKQRRFAFRNEQYFYNRKCDLCKKNIISVYSPDKPNKVYCLNCWWADKWDSKDYGQDFDFNKPFFEQYQKLLINTPTLALMNDNGVQSENCEYTYDFAKGKNAYMVITSWQAENSMYGLEINQVKDVVDCFFVNYSELIYEGVATENSYNCQYIYHCKNIRDCIFSFDLRGCSDCLFCSGLRNKQYCIWNKEYSKEEYEKEKAKYDFSSWKNIQAYKNKFNKFILKSPRRFANLFKCEKSTGDNLVRCHNSQDCYIYSDLLDCQHMHFGDKAKDCMDIDHSGNPEFCYEGVTPDDSYNDLFTVFVWKSKFVYYSDNCHGCSDLFGCVGLKKEKNCILNKQYSEEEYKELKNKIIAHMKETGEWGEFFPVNISPFAYNESLAQDYFPQSKEEVLQKGLTWSDELPQTKDRQSVDWEKIDDNIKKVDKSICDQILSCQDCKNNFKIIKQEFDYYKKREIPIHRLCMHCRYKQRKELINPANLWQRQCMCTQPDHDHQGRCSNEFETTYNPERKELVYCEECYNKEVY